MAIRATSNSYFTVWEVEDHDTYAVVSLSTSRKDKKTDKYANSSWKFIRMVGDAYKMGRKLKERDKITNVQFSMEREPYVDKDGNKVFPKAPRITIFEFELAGGDKPRGKPPVDDYDPPNDGDDGDLPF